MQKFLSYIEIEDGFSNLEHVMERLHEYCIEHGFKNLAEFPDLEIKKFIQQIIAKREFFSNIKTAQGKEETNNEQVAFVRKCE